MSTTTLPTSIRVTRNIMTPLQKRNRRYFALVTGASSGIGKAIAEELARHNLNLLIVALPDTGLEQTGIELSTRYHVEVHTLCINLLDKEAPRRILEFSEQKQIRLQVLVNNAGFGNLELFEETRLEDLTSMMQLNNQALVSLTHYFLPVLKKNRQAYILNVGSLASLFPIPGKAIYSATKSFVYCLSAALRQELRQSSISVSCLCPGATNTSARVMSNLKNTSIKGSTFVQQPEEVAREAVGCLFRKKFRIIPGLHNKVLFALWTILPAFLSGIILRNIFAKSIASKRKKSLMVPVGQRAHAITVAWVQR